IDFQTVMLYLYQSDERANAEITAQRTRDFIARSLQDLEAQLRSTDAQVSTIKSEHGVVDIGSQTGAYTTAKNELEQLMDKIQTQKRVVSMLRQSVLNGNSAIAGLPIEDPSLTALITQYNNALSQVEHYSG